MQQGVKKSNKQEILKKPLKCFMPALQMTHVHYLKHFVGKSQTIHSFESLNILLLLGGGKCQLTTIQLDTALKKTRGIFIGFLPHQKVFLVFLPVLEPLLHPGVPYSTIDTPWKQFEDGITLQPECI